jgi:hypothetical protein
MAISPTYTQDAITPSNIPAASYYQEALSYITSNPILFSSYFKVTINPVNLEKFRSTTLADLSLICESAELPGRSFALTEQKTYGPTKKFPIMTAFNDITLSFICLGVGNEIVPKKFFEDWMESINPRTNYNFQFKNTYAATIYIEQYTPSGKLIYKCELIDAFPIAILPQRLNSASQEQHTLQVAFTYTEFIPFVLSENRIFGDFVVSNNSNIG